MRNPGTSQADAGGSASVNRCYHRRNRQASDQYMPSRGRRTGDVSTGGRTWSRMAALDL